MTRPSNASASPSASWVAAGIIGIAALLRLRGLSSFILEEDELYTLRDAATLNFSAGGSGPGIAGRPLYYTLQHLLLHFGPPTPLYLRLLPFVFGLLGVWLTWRLGRRCFGATGGLVAAALVALSPWHLYASGMARYWSLVYVVSAASVLLLLRALERDRVGDYLMAAAVIALGALTHPSFAFAMAGISLAVFATDSSGRIAVRWPSRREVFSLWGPLALLGSAFVIALKVFGRSGALHNLGDRGLEATLRVVPAMMELMTLPVVVAAAVAALLLLTRDRPLDRRFGLITVLGVTTAMTLIVAAGLKTAVYADYGMAMLPLVYTAIGGAVARVGELVPRLGPWWAGVAVAVLGAATLPGVVSNLVDGMRFDFRPAYRYVQQFAPDRLVVGGPMAEQRYYAPGVRFLEFPPDGMLGLERIARENGNFWLLARYSRLGLQYDDGWSRHWIDLRCRTVLRTERKRYDYRVYRLDLAWCGDERPPGPLGQLPSGSARP